jgi:hypothetical protein
MCLSKLVEYELTLTAAESCICNMSTLTNHIESWVGTLGEPVLIPNTLDIAEINRSNTTSKRVVAKRHRSYTITIRPLSMYILPFAISAK